MSISYVSVVSMCEYCELKVCFMSLLCELQVCLMCESCEYVLHMYECCEYVLCLSVVSRSYL